MSEILGQIRAPRQVEPLEYIEGTVPILITVPHMGSLRSASQHDIFQQYRDTEFATAEIAQKIKSYIDVHILINNHDLIDPNNFMGRSTQFREKIEEIKEAHDIVFILDIHGMADNGMLHLESHERSASTAPALSFVETRYPRSYGRRPDVDLEFRRRARLMSCTCQGAVVEAFKHFMLQLGMSVGVEAVYPGGDIIGAHSDVNTQAMAIEVSRRMRDSLDQIEKLAVSICRSLEYVFGYEMSEDTYDSHQIPTQSEFQAANRMLDNPNSDDDDDMR